MLRDHVYYWTWLLVHLIYALVTEISQLLVAGWKGLSRRLWSCFPLYSTLGDLTRILEVSSSLPKVPKHVAFLVTPEAKNRSWIDGRMNLFLMRQDLPATKSLDSTEINLQTLARVVSWAWAAQVPVISLYDYNGEIKKRHQELNYYLHEEISQNSWAVKKERSPTEPIKIKFHNVSNKDGNANGINGVKTTNPLHILVYSHEDGKSGIVQTAKDICDEDLETKSSLPNMTEFERTVAENSMEVTEARIDSSLNQMHKVLPAEPDLLIVLGNIQSTLGFMPWHIRLTEIHWVPRLSRIDTSDFVNVLTRYGGCQQRFGT